MSISIWQILLILVIILLLFGRNRISDLMGDLGRGITSFKKGLSEDKDKQKPEKLEKNKAAGAKKTRKSGG